MTGIGDEKRTALQWLEASTARLSDFHLAIWAHAEPVWREYRSAADYVSILESEGFSVESGSGEMPTAFAATWGSGRPVLALLRRVRRGAGQLPAGGPAPGAAGGLPPVGAGPHRPSLGPRRGRAGGRAGRQGSDGAARHLPGTLVLFGEPAEKVCGSKPVHAAKGYYDGLDAAISYHPWLRSNTTVWDTHCGSYWSCVFTFECLDSGRPWVGAGAAGLPRATAHRRPAPPAALDAVCLMYTTTKYTKESHVPHDGSWITERVRSWSAGQATADNLPPHDRRRSSTAWRSPTLGIQEQIYRVLASNARHAAGATNCRVSRPLGHARPGSACPTTPWPRSPTANIAAGRRARASRQRPGSSPGRSSGKMGLEPVDDPFTARCQNLTVPRGRGAAVRAGLPPWQKNFTSDDYVEYTWHTPTVRLHTGKPVIQGLSDWAHWGNNALNGFAPAIDPTWLSAARTIATTMIDLVTDSGLLEQATAEFLARTGGGIGGETWVAPLLPRDVIPPVDLPWPEYVETPRGREWHLPTPVTWGEELG